MKEGFECNSWSHEDYKLSVQQHWKSKMWSSEVSGKVFLVKVKLVLLSVY